MTFIRGPVCKGQVPLNVINDHFWVMFLDPDHDLSLKYPGFLKLYADKLRMPTEEGSEYGIFKAIEVAERAVVKKLALSHHDPDHNDTFLESMERECQTRFPNCFLTREGVEIEI